MIVLLRVSSPHPFLCLRFYSSKRRPRLHGVGNKIWVDRGVVRLTHSRPPYWRGLELSCYLVLW